MISSKKALGILSLIGLLLITGNAVLRYRALQRCQASGVDLLDWQGWATDFEGMFRGLALAEWETPFFAFLPRNSPRVVRVGAEYEKLSGERKRGVLPLEQTDRLGKDIGLLGSPEEVDISIRSGIGPLLDGMGRNSRLLDLFIKCDEGFDDEAVSKLSRFPNLKRVQIVGASFSGQSFPPLANIEKVSLGSCESDDSIIRALLACPSLKDVEMDSPNLQPRKAEALKSLPNIQRIEVQRTGKWVDPPPDENNLFEWKR